MPPSINEQGYDYRTILPFRMRNLLDVDELDTDVTPELALPGLLRNSINEALSMGAQARGEEPIDPAGNLLGVMDFSPAGLLARVPGGATLGMNVWHGGPNRWAAEPGFPQGRPRLDKMGTGEGAQQYGRGFYSAEGDAVASNYMPRDYNVEEQMMGLYNAMERKGDYAGMEVMERFLLHDTPEDVASYIKQMDADPAYIKAANQALEAGRDLFRQQQAGTLYKLDIPDADAAKLLDYDAPISAQPKVVQDAITKLGFMPDNPDKLAGGDIWFRMRQQLGEQEAADAMRAAGVPGLRYKDAGSRGKTDSEGTRNFVVWDQDVLDRTKVLQRNDETFEAAPGVPAMSLLNSDNDNRPGGVNLLGLYTGGVI